MLLKVGDSMYEQGIRYYSKKQRRVLWYIQIAKPYQYKDDIFYVFQSDDLEFHYYTPDSAAADITRYHGF